MYNMVITVNTDLFEKVTKNSHRKEKNTFSFFFLNLFEVINIS